MMPRAIASRATKLAWATTPCELIAYPPMAGELPEVVEPETNHSAATAMELTAPVTVHGRFRTDSEEDWYRIAGHKGEAYTIQCQPFPPGSPAMPVLTLEDAAGNIAAR